MLDPELHHDKIETMEKLIYKNLGNHKSNSNEGISCLQRIN
jgi:hypothetical protein